MRRCAAAQQPEDGKHGSDEQQLTDFHANIEEQ